MTGQNRGIPTCRSLFELITILHCLLTVKNRILTNCIGSVIVMHSIQRAGRFVTYLTKFLFIRRWAFELVSRTGAYPARGLFSYEWKKQAHADAGLSNYHILPVEYIFLWLCVCGNLSFSRLSCTWRADPNFVQMPDHFCFWIVVAVDWVNVSVWTNARVQLYIGRSIVKYIIINDCNIIDFYCNIHTVVSRDKSLL